MKKKLGDGLKINTKKKWSFNNGVYKKFDQHILKSVPGYTSGHDIILSIARDVLPSKTKVLDIGCSTGVLLKKLAKQKSDNSKYIGIDTSKEMINFAKQNNPNNIKFYCKNLDSFKQKSFDLIISYFTMQFIPLKNKILFLENIFNKLEVGGIFILFEKVINNNGNLKNIFEHSYRDFKLKNGYTELEIFNKDESLRGAMFPCSREKNFEFLTKAKFKNIQVIQQNLMFEGYIMNID